MAVRWRIWAWRGAAAAGAALGGAALFVGFCFFTAPGAAVVAALIEPLSGGEVKVQGLSGSLPDHLAAQRVEVRDAAGTWLIGENVHLDWQAISALGDNIRIARVEAGKITVLRRRVPSQSSSPSTTVVDIEAISAPQIALAAPVLGHPAVLSASGKVHYASRHDMAADLAIRRLDGDGQYDISAVVAEDAVQGTVAVREGGAGLIGGLAGLPDLGAVVLNARAIADGSRNTVTFDLVAGAAKANGGGQFDLKHETADVTFTLSAPAMAPRKDLRWAEATAHGRFYGSFARPDIDAAMTVSGLSASGVRFAGLDLTVTGHGGKAHLGGSVHGLAFPGDEAVFAAAPLAISADADLASSAVTFVLRHPVATLRGVISRHENVVAKISAEVPALKLLAPLTGVAADGSATLTADVAQNAKVTHIKAEGRIATRGNSAVARVLGTATLKADIEQRDDGTKLQATVDGAAVKGALHGDGTRERQSYAGHVAISDLSRLAPTLIGKLEVKGSLTGAPDNAKLALEGTALAATKGSAPQGVRFTVDAAGLPHVKAAHIRASGKFDGSPVSVKADVSGSGAGSWKVDLADAAWRSAHAQGSMTIAGRAPQGSVSVRVARLADLAPLIGSAMTGSLEARADFHPGTAVVRAAGDGIGLSGVMLDHMEIAGAIGRPFEGPSLALSVSVPHFATASVSGSAMAQVNGPLQALSVSATSSVATSGGTSAALSADAVLDTRAHRVAIARLDTKWHGRTISLAAPASLEYADGVTFAATFVDKTALQLALSGSVSAKGALALKANGSADLGVLVSGLAAMGQNVRGSMAFDLSVAGTTAHPLVFGTASLSKGQIQDYTRGISFADIDAKAAAEGTVIRLTAFTAKAGRGTVTGGGTIDLLSPGTPVDMAFKSDNARPIVSDLMTANLDSDLKLSGRLSDGLTLSGTITVRHGNINIPDTFAKNIATLNVRRNRTKAAPPPSPLRIGLALTLSSPGQIFVRGRGLEAEFEGNLKIVGTADAPQVLGALEMRRGTFSLAGAALTFTSGTIGFNGRSLRGRMDPSLNLVAESEANGITATLKIAGTASQPKIELTSSPQLPQDEILAQLLFQQSATSLSAGQLAGVAQAAASLGGGLDPVGAVRRGLGLDRLALGSNQTGTETSTTIEAGKYVLRNVYIGARQDMSGGTKALVQVDLTRHLKAQAQVNTGPRAPNTTSTLLQDQGDTIGLSYQFEY